MHRYLGKLMLGSGLLLSSGVALAQDKAADAPADQDTAAAPANAGSETEATDVAEPTPAAGGVKVKSVPGAKDVLPGKVHTVVTGDTLWDLSQTYLGTPWYWPKVWSYNPHIANPHWIYPGNQVRFFPAGDEGPSRVEVEDDDNGEEAVSPSAELDPDTFHPDQKAQTSVLVTGKIGYTPPKQTGGWVRRQGFLSSREMDQVGTLTESPEQQLFLSPPDKVYLTFKHPQNAKIGDHYLIFRTDRDIYNPRTGRWAGYFTRILGTLKVLGVENKRVIGQLDRTWEEIERGNLVGPFGEPYLERLVPRPNDRKAAGYILSSIDPMMVLGQDHYVLVDLGSAEGVQVGNTFTVIRQNDPSLLASMVDNSENTDRRLPRERIATCLAVDVREKASLCLLTHTITDVIEGDRVVMEPDASTPSASR
jgi:LysM repeat protein